MEHKIRLLIKYFCIAMLGVFSTKCIDEFLPPFLVQDRISDKSFEKDGGRLFYTLHTANNGSFDVPAPVYHNTANEASVEVAYSNIFSEIQSLRIKANDRKLIIGNTESPNITQFLLDLLVIALCITSLLVPYRFELKALPFFFSIIAAAIRWWFIPIQW